MKKEFSFKTIDKFDKHISQSIRGFDHLEDIFLKSLSICLPKDNPNILDIGCSTGRFLKKSKELYPNLTCTGIDIEPKMIENKVYQGELIINDITTYNIESKYDAIISMFTIQFLPKKNQLHVLKKMFESLNVGGGLFISEKIYLDNGIDQSIVNSLFYEYKLGNFTGDDILNKEIDLRRIMRPSTESELINNLKTCGFKSIIPIWRVYQFVGLICIK